MVEVILYEHADSLKIPEVIGANQNSSENAKTDYLRIYVYEYCKILLLRTQQEIL
jgi:hypothetical protein